MNTIHEQVVDGRAGALTARSSRRTRSPHACNWAYRSPPWRSHAESMPICCGAGCMRRNWAPIKESRQSHPARHSRPRRPPRLCRYSCPQALLSGVTSALSCAAGKRPCRCRGPPTLLHSARPECRRCCGDPHRFDVGGHAAGGHARWSRPADGAHRRGVWQRARPPRLPLRPDVLALPCGSSCHSSSKE